MPTSVFAYAAIVMVVAAVIGGIWLAGWPSQERLRQFDQTRVDDLRQIATSVDAYYQNEGHLPANLDLLAADVNGKGYYVRSLVDPEKSEPYGYQIVSAVSYQLCADFALDSKDLDTTSPAVAVPVGIWPENRQFTHQPGRACFTLDAGASAGPTCGLRNPCAGGQNCVILPHLKNAVCVPTGKECAAAQCASGSCTVAESYPAQVTCLGDKQAPADGCQMMRGPNNGAIGCFGCVRGVCNEPPSGWTIYSAQQKAGTVGIPYACYEDPVKGCQLAQ